MRPPAAAMRKSALVLPPDSAHLSKAVGRQGKCGSTFPGTSGLAEAFVLLTVADPFSLIGGFASRPAAGSSTFRSSALHDRQRSLKEGAEEESEAGEHTQGDRSTCIATSTVALPLGVP